MRVRTAVLFLLAVRTACGWTSKRVHRPCLQPRKWTARFIPFTLQAVNDPEEEKRAAFVAGKGLEGSGPIVVVNKLAPIGFRYALYGLFSIVGVAGVAIAITQGNPQDYRHRTRHRDGHEDPRGQEGGHFPLGKEPDAHQPDRRRGGGGGSR